MQLFPPRLVRALCIASLCAAATSASAAPAAPAWMLLSRATGCEPLSALHADYPALQAIHQPKKIWTALHQQYPDTTILPLLDVIAQERKADPTISAEEKAFFRPVTKRNAYVISSKAQRIEWYVVTKALCDQLMRPPKTQ